MRLERFVFRAMGSPCELQLWGPSREALGPHAEACRREVLRLEHKFSRYRHDSLATRINRSAGDPRGVEVDAETAGLLDFANTAWHESDGRFDPTSGVLRRAWRFDTRRLPDPAELEALRGLVGWSRLRWSKPRLILPYAGMELDFGGFVKEYAADRVAELCRSRGLAAGIIDLGGDLAVVGPHPDGSPWRVGIRHPRKPGHALARIALAEGGLATSGDYERCMVVDGERYSHLLDPRTGQSFREGPACVSVVAPHCLIAGVTSTIAMLHVEPEADEFLAGLGLPHLIAHQSGEVSGTANGVVPAEETQAARSRSAETPRSAAAAR
jgi:thiamine biosynthesis lipoprotein